MSKLWTVRLAEKAEQDFSEIGHWSAAHFGRRQATIYAETLALAISSLAEGPDVSGARQRNEIGDGILTLHVARQGRRGQHFVVFHVVGEGTIDVLRLLHDGMDLTRHRS